MTTTKIQSTTKAFGHNVYKDHFGNQKFPIHPISPGEGAYASSIKLKTKDMEVEVDITLYFYTDSAITSNDISLEYVHDSSKTVKSNLYVKINKAQNPTPTDVTLWKLTANTSDSLLNFTEGESIELYCQNPQYADDQTNGPTTSRGTKVSVKSGTGEI